MERRDTEASRTGEEPFDDAISQFRYVHSDNLPDLLQSQKATLLVSTYQAGKLIAFRARNGTLSMLLRSFDRAMGLAVAESRLAIGAKHQVWLLRNSPQLAARSAEGHDAMFLPRVSFVTGDLDLHEMAWGQDELWVVNTLFSCLCTLHTEFSFVPRWRPPFVTRLTRQDRCHLNGLAIVAGRPKFVTAFGATDTPEGWRPGKANGGVLMELPDGNVVTSGLSMPHSPRVYADRLWVLDSGRGHLASVDRARGSLEMVAQLPGYTRGLAFCGPYAFVGYSKIRESSVFGGVPIAGWLRERKCGIGVIDLRSGKLTGYIEFEGIIEEIFDVQILAGACFPQIVGVKKDLINRACLIGPEIGLEGSMSPP